MKIAIDLRPFQTGHEFRGIGAYISNLLTHFPFEHLHTFIFVRYDSSNPIKDLGIKLKTYEEVVVTKPVEAQAPKHLLELLKRRLKGQFGDLSRHKPDVYFQPDFMLGLPKGRMKKYVVMYDLIPLVLRKYYLPSWRELLTKPGLGKRRRIKIVAATWLRERGYKARLKNFRRADRIICISDATAHDAQTLLGIPRTKLRTTHLAASIPDQAKPEMHRPKRLAPTQTPYLLFIGGVDERRRLADLVHAFNLLNGRGRKLDLVLAGKELFDAKQIPNVQARNAIMESSYRNQIHLLGYTTQEEKTWLLKNAFAFVYPSIYEGFGLPILEAMSQECPVISYKNSSITEVSNGAAILLKEQNGIGIKKAVLELLDNPSERKKMAKLGKKQSAKFSWHRCAEKTYEIITE